MSTALRLPAIVSSALATSLREVFAPLVVPVPAVRQPATTSPALPRIILHVTATRVRGVPRTIPAGRYQLTVVDDRPASVTTGALTLLRLPDGMTLDDLLAVADAAIDPPTVFYDALLPGGTEFGPDGVSEAIIDLAPGTWVVAGYAMTTAPTVMTVTGTMPAALPAPAANATITLRDGALRIDGVLHQGTNRIRIDNLGTEPHFVTIDRLPAGATDASIAATIEAGLGLPTATPAIPLAEIEHIIATTDQSAGTAMWFTVDLPAGTVAVIGDQPDRGMYTTTTVR